MSDIEMTQQPAEADQAFAGAATPVLEAVPVVPAASATPAPEAPGVASEAAEKPRRTRRSRAAAKEAAPENESSPATSSEALTDAASKGREASGKDASEKSSDKASEKPSEKSSEGNSDSAKPEADGQGEKAVSDAAAGEPEQTRPRRQKKERRNDRDRNDRDRDAGGSGKKGGEDNRGNRNNRDSRNNRNNRDDKQGNHRRQRRQGQQNREVLPSVTMEELAKLKVAELRAKAQELELDVTGLKKAELVEAVFAASVKAEGFTEVEGVLDIMSEGYGFLRVQGYLTGEGDAYVPLNLIRRNGLRKGDLVKGQTRPMRDNESRPAIQKILLVNGRTLEESQNRPRFADLTPVFPDERLVMEHGKNTITARVIDLCAPIGKGQRGLIVSPPKAGKTTVLKNIAAAISANNPEVHLMCLLVDERPEEVTDMQRSINGEVIASTFDMPCENHIAIAEMVIERAKRLVENGEDVVILLDSLTRLARAYNLAQPASGRILSGGVDSTALYPPKKFLGAARNIEGGGSLTILASALVETGSKMDEVIFEEFKGTGNMELKLDRQLADRRIFPAIDPVTSGTRREDLLLDPQEAPLIWAVRRILSNLNNTERAMSTLIKSLKQTDTNQEFLIRTAKKAQTQHGKLDENLEL